MRLSEMLRLDTPHLREYKASFLEPAHPSSYDQRPRACALGKLLFLQYDGNIAQEAIDRRGFLEHGPREQTYGLQGHAYWAAHKFPELNTTEFDPPSSWEWPKKYDGQILARYIDSAHIAGKSWLEIADFLEANGL
jgi:hypothetical protein